MAALLVGVFIVVQNIDLPRTWSKLLASLHEWANWASFQVGPSAWEQPLWEQRSWTASLPMAMRREKCALVIKITSCLMRSQLVAGLMYALSDFASP